MDLKFEYLYLSSKFNTEGILLLKEKIPNAKIRHKIIYYCIVLGTYKAIKKEGKGKDGEWLYSFDNRELVSRAQEGISISKELINVHSSLKKSAKTAIKNLKQRIGYYKIKNYKIGLNGHKKQRICYLIQEASAYKGDSRYYEKIGKEIENSLNNKENLEYYEEIENQRLNLDNLSEKEEAELDKIIAQRFYQEIITIEEAFYRFLSKE